MICSNVEWSAEAEAGLNDTYNIPEFKKIWREGVESGRMQLWRINSESWAITETLPDRLLVWAFQGRDVREFAQSLWHTCVAAGIENVDFYTRHHGLRRMLRHMRPVSQGDGIWRIRVYRNAVLR